jgi:hypothetical protein
MTPGQGGRRPQSRSEVGDEAGPWRRARPELAVAAVALLCGSTAAYILAGVPGTVVVVVVFTAFALVVLAVLVPRGSLPSARPNRGRQPTNWVRSYWRVQLRLREGTASVFAYQFGLRPQLEHLLAARLAQRHGINLYTDPEAARRVLCAHPRDRDLWDWVDPARQPPDRSDARGIPPRALARLVRRLEQM